VRGRGRSAAGSEQRDKLLRAVRPHREGRDSARASKGDLQQAIERGNVVAAEAAAREIGLTLDVALQLVLLYAAYELAKLERAALPWFARYLDESRACRC
jgi:hypothetical protein